MTESPFKNLTRENKCQLREIQEASHRINYDPHTSGKPFLEDHDKIINDVRSYTHAKYDSKNDGAALNDYYTMFKRWGLIDNPQCKAPNNSRGH